MVQAHALDGLGDPNGLAKVEHTRPPGLDGAEAASPRAGVAEDHEGRGASLPALPDIGAARLLAHRVQLEAAHDALQLGIVVAAGKAHAQPLRPLGVDRDHRVPLRAAIELDRSGVSHCYKYPRDLRIPAPTPTLPPQAVEGSSSVKGHLLGEAF